MLALLSKIHLLSRISHKWGWRTGSYRVTVLVLTIFNSALRYVQIVQAGKSYYGAARPGIELGSKIFEICTQILRDYVPTDLGNRGPSNWIGPWKL